MRFTMKRTLGENLREGKTYELALGTIRHLEADYGPRELWCIPEDSRVTEAIREEVLQHAPAN